MIKYRAFIKVVELGSITAAAKELGYSQPGVSHMLDTLEHDMGFPLLIRNKEKIVPTEDGKRILECCYQIIQQEDNLNDVKESILNLIAGNLTISAQNSMLVHFIPKVTSNFLNAYSSITIKIEERHYEDSQTALLNGSTDIAFMAECKTKGIEFYKLFKDPLCLLVPADHPFASADKVTVSMLNGCDFIMPTENWDSRVKIALRKSSVKPNIKHYVASDTAGISMVNEKLGVYILSKLQTSNLPPNVVVKYFEEDLSRTMGFAVRSMKNITPSLNEYIKTAKAVAEQFK